MTYQRDAGFLQALILGQANSPASGALARLVVMRVQYRAARDAGMVYLVQRAVEALTVALAHAAEVAEAADRAYLESLIAGTEDLLSEDIFPRMKLLFSKYPEGSPMYALLEKAATLFGEVVQAHAHSVLAEYEAQEAIAKAQGQT